MNHEDTKSTKKRKKILSFSSLRVFVVQIPFPSLRSLPSALWAACGIIGFAPALSRDVTGEDFLKDALAVLFKVAV